MEFILLPIILIVINLCATSAFAGVAKEKGRSDCTPVVWALGIFCSVLVAGLYVAALPDWSVKPAASPQPAAPKDELPAI